MRAASAPAERRTGAPFSPALLPYDLSRGGSPFIFHATGNINQYAFYAQDAITAGNFLFNREKQVEWLSGSMDGRPALIVAPYDAELFGQFGHVGLLRAKADLHRAVLLLHEN